MGNESLNTAARAKKDEFFTQAADIAEELQHYREHFRGKTVLCNCNDAASNFFRHFAAEFDALKLKRLIATNYTAADDKPAYAVEIRDGNSNTRQLVGNGDFRSAECVDLLKQADIVVTNPPFSLFREYVAQLIAYDKKFLIIGNLNAVTYKEIFPLIMQNKIWLGYGFRRDPQFKVPDDYAERSSRFWIDAGGQCWRSFGNLHWFTNLDTRRRHADIPLRKKFSPENYPRYDDFDAIEVSKTADIPADYFGVMGVPITFLGKHNPAQFEIVGKIDSGAIDAYNLANPTIGGKNKFKRIAIRRTT